MNTEYGWIYIGTFAENLKRCKIGFSRVSKGARFKVTTIAPDYVPFRYYKIPIHELTKLEKYLHKELNFHFSRIHHLHSGSPSEWFRCHPMEAARLIENNLPKCLDLETTDEGFDLFNIIHVPNYEYLMMNGAWGDESGEFLKLFLDENGEPLPYKTFVEWE